MRNYTLASTFPYWNLSCPLEMSSFSAAHTGETDYVNRAYKALEVAYPAAKRIQQSWPGMGKRRLFFVGDSLLRQVFISLTCLLHDEVEHYAVPWFERRGANRKHPNTFGQGPHSKFEEARVWMKDGTELIYHHGIGGLLTLGRDYHSHDHEKWTLSCWEEKPFKAQVVSRDNRKLLDERRVNRELIQLAPDDIVILNGSVHGERMLNLNNIANLATCVNRSPRRDELWPKLVYVVTGAEHFPTQSGFFEEELLNATGGYKCRQESVSIHRQIEERFKLEGLLPILGNDLLALEQRSGDLHMGGGDCLHWTMPGIPDLLSSSLIDSLNEIINPKVSMQN